MPSSVQVDQEGNIVKRQTSVWLDSDIFELSKALGRKWKLPANRYFSLVVSRAVREAAKREGLVKLDGSEE